MSPATTSNGPFAQHMHDMCRQLFLQVSAISNKLDILSYTKYLITRVLESKSRVEVYSDSGHMLLLDCTLSLVLHGFDQCTVLAGHATSSTSCHHATLLPHIQLKQFSLITQSVCHTISPRVGVEIWSPKLLNPRVGVLQKISTSLLITSNFVYICSK